MKVIDQLCVKSKFLKIDFKQHAIIVFDDKKMFFLFILLSENVITTYYTFFNYLLLGIVIKCSTNAVIKYILCMLIKVHLM